VGGPLQRLGYDKVGSTVLRVPSLPEPTFSRRAVLRAGAFGAAALAAGGALAPLEAEADVTEGSQLPQGVYAMNQGWLFGGVYATGAEQPGYSEAGFGAVTVPHTVTPLSWGAWNSAAWEKLWIYRKHISSTAVSSGRVFVDFQGVMTTATVWINGTLLATHQGGYLPFSVELTDEIVAGDNVLAVQVNCTLQDVPPSKVTGGDAAIDYLQPGGIYRDVRLRVVPEIYVADVFAKPVNVLSTPGLDVQATLDCGVSAAAVTVTASLLSGSTVIATTSTQVAASKGSYLPVSLSLPSLPGISLWSPENPALYGVQVTATLGQANHVFTTRTGFREAVFEIDGFYLNGNRYEIFGLNRHQLFPYLGMAGPQRLQVRDAEILKNELSCNMVRCSHYPQSEYFLDACDELGLMVWEEPPGWQYVGDSPFQQIVQQNVEDMVLRDRSRPSVIVWATRLNETPNDETLYASTGQIAQSLDGTRQTTGAMDIYSTTGWNQQVFAYDDYHSVNGDNQDATLNPPLAGVPYMVSEAVGALDGAPLYRWIDPQATLALQGQMHAQVHSIAQGNSAYAGLLGWCGFDYQSYNGGDRVWNDMKTPGVTDTFRVPKPGAGFYASQAPASAGPVIVPGFFWDFGTASPASGPGEGAIVFTNCEQLNLYVGEQTTPAVTGTPDTSAFPNLAAAPVLLNVPAVDGSVKPPLKIEGLVGGQVVATLNMSSNTSQDVLALTFDDQTIIADGTDVARFTLRIVDAYGNHRPLGSASDLQATFALSGPGTLITDNPFSIGFYGGVAGGFVQSVANVAGTVTLTASCPGYVSQSVSLQIVAGTSQPGPLGSGGPRVLTAPPSASAPPTRTLARRSSTETVQTAAVSRLESAIRAALRGILSPSGAGARIGRLLKHGYELKFSAPEEGTLVVGWYRQTVVHTGGRRTVHRLLVASAHAHVRRAGRARVHVSLSARGRALLRAARAEQLLAEVSFTATGQRPVTETREITLHR
jgi:beta-galactosidase